MILVVRSIQSRNIRKPSHAKLQRNRHDLGNLKGEPNVAESRGADWGGKDKRR